MHVLAPCTDNSINIMCNVHILDEGIDIPTCDSIYLTHPNNNPTNIIQRISRANRLDDNNKDKIAKIFLWTKDKMKLKGSQTAENLLKAFAGESQARNRYTYFASEAKKAGFEQNKKGKKINVDQKFSFLFWSRALPLFLDNLSSKCLILNEMRELEK